MSSTTIYRCDVCGLETTRDDLKTVAVGIKSYGSCSCGNQSVYYKDPQHREKDMCGECLKKFGLSPDRQDKDPTPTYPTFEDMIREIVKEEIR